MSNKDQFAGFGRAVIMRLLAQRQWGWIDFNEWDKEEIEEYSAIVACAAYDFACHVVSHTSEKSGALLETDNATPQEIVDEMPDMAKLPEETSND